MKLRQMEKKTVIGTAFLLPYCRELTWTLNVSQIVSTKITVQLKL